MITEVHLENYRCFIRHKVKLGPMEVIVGENNAGKTTLVEALRLVALVTQRYKNLSYNPGPSWSDIPRREYGVAPSLQDVDINYDTLRHRYDTPPPSIIRAFFSNGACITIYLYRIDRVHAVVRDCSGDIVRSKAQANRLDLPLVQIMPQVAPLAREESILDPEYVRRHLSSPLAPIHFRNQLNRYYDLFPAFQALVEETWPGVRVLSLEGQGGKVTAPLALEVRNEDFAAEAANMGHGLQMWLQTMWFLTRTRAAACVILDEPDVYMHADVQRRLIRYLRNKWPQTLVTTHSVEIMSECPPECITVVDRRKDESSHADSLPAVQRVIDHVGSIHNLNLMRLWRARRFLLVEGDDLSILKKLHDALFPDSDGPLEAIPHMSVGGWGGWRYAIGSSMTLQNSFGERIVTYCLLDSDYHTPEQIVERHQEATTAGVNLHIWEKKELENYLLNPSALSRLINARRAERTDSVSENEIHDRIQSIADTMEDRIFDALSVEYLAADRAGGAATANRNARERIRQAKAAGRLADLTSGKEMLSELSSWSKTAFGVSFSAEAAATAMKAGDIPDEMRVTLSSIEFSRDFTN